MKTRNRGGRPTSPLASRTNLLISLGVIVLAACVGGLNGWSEVTNKLPDSAQDQRILVAIISSITCALSATGVVAVALYFERRKAR